MLILLGTKIVSTAINNDNTTETITVNGNKMTIVIIMIITIIMIIVILSSDITLVTKHVNEVNEMLKGVPAKNLTELEYVARASALLICEKVGVKIDHQTKKNHFESGE